MKLEDKISEIAERFESSNIVFGHGTDNAWDEAAWIVLRVLNYDLGKDVVENRIDWDRELDQGELVAIEAMVDNRIEKRQPFAYLVKETWFAGQKFYIDERAIVPRSFLGEWIPDQFSPWIDPDSVNSILDLCTGCGCIAITCALNFPGSRVVASDISEAALEVAQYNINQYGLSERVALNQGDGFGGIQEKFDVIVCNPPYVSNARMDRLPAEYLKEPDQAFRGGKDGLDFIIPLLQRAKHYLKENGTLFVEAGSASHALEDRFPNVPFTWLSTEYDEMVVFCMTVEELNQFSDVFDVSETN